MANDTCTHPDGCPKPVHKAGLCSMHYQRLQRHGDIGPAGRLRLPPDPDAPCSVEGCSNKVQARGMCGKHYQEDRAIRNGAAQCRRAGCTLLAVLDGLCRPHYNLRRRMDEEQELRDARRCSVPGCKRPYDAAGYCSMHYQRVRYHGDPGEAGERRAPRGAGHLGKDGYRYIRQRDGKLKAEHRIVMERLLGRDLYGWENVHHRNGLRADNAPHNLELWVVGQPAGQRVADIAAFIAEFYADELTALGWRLAA